MVKKVKFSERNLNFSSIIDHHVDTQNALKSYYAISDNNGMLPSRFLGYTKSELLSEYRHRIQELENTTTFTMLSSIEASFRIDYLKRVYGKSKDPVSREFRSTHKEKGNKASLEKDILTIWKNHYSEHQALISELIGAFKFRHWLAHGRYWEPKLGRKYDYAYTYDLSSQVYLSLPFIA